jgi:hypothetical protein
MKLYGSRGLKMSSLIRRSNVVVGLTNDKEHSSLSAMASHFIIYIVSLVVHEDVDHLKIKLDLKKQQNPGCGECGPRSVGSGSSRICISLSCWIRIRIQV